MEQQLGTNVQAKVEGNILTLTIDMSQNHGPSKSGKTIVVASTNGFANINGLMIGLNVNKKG